MPSYLSGLHYRHDDHVHYCEDDYDDAPIMLKSYADDQDSHLSASITDQQHHNIEPQTETATATATTTTTTTLTTARQKQAAKHDQQMHSHSHSHSHSQPQPQPQPQTDTHHYLTIEELRVAFNSCWLCGCNWLQDHISLDCPECGGYALTRPCPNCDGKCKQTWKRNITATHDLQRAHWSGHCKLPSAAAERATPKPNPIPHATCNNHYCY